MLLSRVCVCFLERSIQDLQRSPRANATGLCLGHLRNVVYALVSTCVYNVVKPNSYPNPSPIYSLLKENQIILQAYTNAIYKIYKNLAKSKKIYNSKYIL